jgi:tetratricopeptide (TPR) repeat protein
MGRYEEARNRWRELLRASASGPEEATAMFEMARTELDLGGSERAEEMCQRVLAMDPDSETKASALLLLARIGLTRNDLGRVRDLLEAIERLPSPLPQRARAERTAMWSGYMAQRGNFEEAERWAKEALQYAEELSDVDLTLKSKRDLGIVQLVLGRLTEARAILEDVLTGAMESAHTVRAYEAIANLVCVYLLLGDLRSGAACGREAIQWLPVGRWRAGVLDNLGAIEFEMAESAIARAHLRECVEISEHSSDAQLVGTLARMRLATIDLSEGLIDQAEIATREALRNAEATDGRVDIQVKCRVQLAEVALTRGNAADANRYATSAIEMVTDADKTEKPGTLRVLGLAQSALGRLAARETLEEALALARSMGLRLEEARTLTAIGLLHGHAPNLFFQQAREVFAVCGCERGLTELRQAVAAVRSA